MRCFQIEAVHQAAGMQSVAFSLTGMQLGFDGDVNIGRQEQPINLAGDSDRRSKSGPDLPSDHLLNAAAAGSVPLDQIIMASEYNHGTVQLYMGDLLDIVKYPYDPTRMMIDDSWIILIQVWVLLKCVKLLFSVSILCFFTSQ